VVGRAKLQASVITPFAIDPPEPRESYPALASGSGNRPFKNALNSHLIRKIRESAIDCPECLDV
jgi:hypothetical protein